MLLIIVGEFAGACGSLSYLTWLSPACQFPLIDIASMCHYLHHKAGAKSSPVITCFSRNVDSKHSGECKGCHENLKIETQACGLSRDLHDAFNSNISTEVNMLQTEELCTKNVKIEFLQVCNLQSHLPQRSHKWSSFLKVPPHIGRQTSSSIYPPFTLPLPQGSH